MNFKENELRVKYEDRTLRMFFDSSNLCYTKTGRLEIPVFNGNLLSTEEEKMILNMKKHYNASLEEYAYNVISKDELQKEEEKFKEYLSKFSDKIFKYNKKEQIIENGERKFKVIKNYDIAELEAEEKNNKEIEKGIIIIKHSEWECGFNFYQLGTRLDKDGWNLIKKYFKYCKRGWSEYHELEWYHYEPTGWLTQDIEKVIKKLESVGYKIRK